MQLRKVRFIALVAAVCSMWGAYLSATELPASSKLQVEVPSEEATSSLNLFMSAEEQNSAENRNSQIKADGELPIKTSDKEAVAPEGRIDASENNMPKAKPMAPSALNNKYKPARYDGVVLRNGAVLGLWLNAQRLPVSEGGASVQFESVRANGQASFSGTLKATGNTATVRLNPGDLVPFMSTEFDQILQGSMTDASITK